jgi:glycosyltransferase involved in cell wall biosynthesis
MKILITHEVFPPEAFGGGELVVFEIAKRLIMNGFDVKVLTTGNPKIKAYNGITTIRLPVHRYFMNLAAPWIYRYSKDCDLIQTNNYNACYPSFLAGKWAKKPVVCLVHGIYGDEWIDMRGQVFGRLSKWIEKFQLCQKYNKIIFLSEHAGRKGLKMGIPRGITEVIKPGIPRGFKSYKMGKKEPFVLFVGRLAKQKGLDYLIAAAKELPDMKFILAGKGEEEKRLKSIAPPNVEFLGFVSQEKLIKLYAKAQIFCLPSIGEGFGLVLLEAMASGCAIVSTIDIGQKGILIKPKSSEEIVKAIKYFIENKEDALKCGKENRKLAKNFSWNKFFTTLIKIYDSITK